MKKLVVLIVFALSVGFGVQAQPHLTVTWKGELGCDEVPIDSVQVTNLTKDWTTTVFYPENSIKLYHSVGVKEVNDFADKQIRVIPNPFSQTAEVSFYVGKEGVVKITIYDIFGRTVASFSQNMDCGMQQVLVNAGSSGYYFLAVETPTERRVAKMLSMGDCGQAPLIPPEWGRRSVEEMDMGKNLWRSPSPSFGGNKGGLKFDEDDFPFEVGDSMQFVAYATDMCEKVYAYLPYSERIVADKNILFHADEEPLDSLVLIAKGSLTGDEGIPKQNLVIKTQSEWENLLTAMNSVNNVSDSFAKTDIDFCRYQIIAVFDTVRTGNGWSIDIVDILEDTDSIVVTYTNLDTGYFSQAITQPYYIVKIPDSDKPIVFIDETTPDILVCKDVMFSECGMSLEENEEDSVLLVDTITETTFGDLRILYKGAHLHFTHHEIGLNCAHTQVDVALSIVSDTIEVNIVETPWGMNCICYVDVSYSIGKIERGMYELIIRYRNNIRYSQTINF